MEMLLIGLLIGIVIGFFWGVWRTTQGFIERIIDHPEEIKELMVKFEQINRDAEDEIAKINNTDQEYEFKTEWHNDVCYLYDIKDNFLAQGASVVEAMSHAEKRFPELKLKNRANSAEQSSQ